DIALYDTTKPYSLHLGTGYRGLVLLIPRNQLRLKPRHLDSVLCNSLADADNHHLAKLLINLLMTLTDDLDKFSHEDPWISQHVIDLINVVLERRAGIVREHLDAAVGLQCSTISQYIRAHIMDKDLSVDSIAKAFCVSIRKLHKIYESSPTTVGQL